MVIAAGAFMASNHATMAQAAGRVDLPDDLEAVMNLEKTGGKPDPVSERMAAERQQATIKTRGTVEVC